MNLSGTWNLSGTVPRRACLKPIGSSPQLPWISVGASHECGWEDGEKRLKWERAGKEFVT